MERSTRYAVSIFVIGFVVRGLSAVVTTLTTLNPDSGKDAAGFSNTAAAIARGIQNGDPYLYTSASIDLWQFLFPIASVDTYNLWGSFLAPFWLLPGPSGLYARLWHAFLGAFAIYNVYLIARHYRTHHAGVIATLPLMFYPSIVAIHSTLLREAMILFGITTAARLLLIPSQTRSRLFSYGLVAVLLHVVSLLRADNLVIYVAAIAAALAGYALTSGYISKRAVGTGVILSPIGYVLALPLIQDGVRFLAYTRDVRASGRAIYLPEVIPRTIFELIGFSWIGAAYFLYAPFPWMIETAPDFLVATEGIINIVFTVFAVWGVRSLGQKNIPATVGLVVGFALSVVLYGVGTANYGTGMRHRQMFLWVVFLFGGIGLTDYFRFKWQLRR